MATCCLPAIHKFWGASTAAHAKTCCADAAAYRLLRSSPSTRDHFHDQHFLEALQPLQGSACLRCLASYHGFSRVCWRHGEPISLDCKLCCLLQLEILQHARRAAVEQASKAARQAEELRASARQHAWAQRLLDTLLADQLQHNQDRAQALRTLLEHAAIPGSQTEGQPGSTTSDEDDSEYNEQSPSKLPAAAGRPIIADLKAHLLQLQLQENAA